MCLAVAYNTNHTKIDGCGANCYCPTTKEGIMKSIFATKVSPIKCDCYKLRMKKAIAAFIISTIVMSIGLFIFVLPTAQAQTTCSWARVIANNVKIYATQNGQKALFLLQKSYYLRILADEGDMLMVALMENENGFVQITGYVYTSEVDLVVAQPEPPYYPMEKIIVTADSTPIRLSATPNATTVITATNTQQLYYYGSITSYNTLWHYVYYGGKFGYVLADTVSSPVVSKHPTPLPQDYPVVLPNPPAEGDSDTVVEPNPPTLTAEITLIIFVVLLAIGLALSLFLPGNNKHNNVFDESI